MIGSVLRRLGRLLGLLVCWALWLALGGLLALQLYIAAHHEAAVPRPLLDAMQSRLSFAGLRADFGRTRFDPTGRILMENVRLRFAGFDDPVLTASVVAVRLRPLALLAGRLEARDIRVSGLSLRVPAMFSPSGTSDEIVSDADLEVVPRAGWVRLPYFSAKAGRVAVAGSAEILLPASAAARAASGGAIAPVYARRYAQLAQAASSWLAALGAVESPVVRLRVESNADRSLGVEAVVDADSIRVPGEGQVQADRVRAIARWRFRSEASAPVTVDFEADRLSLRGIANVRGVLGSVEVQPLADGAWPARVRSVSLAARSMVGDGIPVLAPYGQFDVARYPAVSGRVAGLVWGQPVAVSGTADVVARSADLAFRARIDSGARNFLETHRMKGIRSYLDWSEPIAAEGECRFGDGGHFAQAWARVSIHGLVARTVRIDDAGGRVSFDGLNLRAERAFARIGSDVAVGSFEQDRQGNYRFLLRGRLRPLDIAPWIAGGWWPAFFGNFAFPTVPPTADIDLRGNWTDGTRSEIFVKVDAPGAQISGLGFDSLTGRLFVRPQFVDVLNFSVSRGAGTAEGAFSRSFNADLGDWDQLDLKVTSTLDPGPALSLLGPDASAAIAGIDFQAPPRVEVSGTLTGPGSVSGSHRRLAVIAHSDRRITFHRLPFDGASFVARLVDDDLTIDNAEADVAGGHAVGTGELFGPQNARKLRFSVSVANLSLPQAISTAAGLAGRADPSAGNSSVSKFIQPKSAVRVNATASAEGRWGFPYSFHGSGTIDLQGGEIGQLHMLGLLSDLLRFTSLRFTGASAEYIIDGRSIDFPEISVLGANSAILAKGTCDLDTGELDIRAKLNPFQQSHALPQKFMDLVLAPLANALEVRLVGTLAKPDWVFVNGPGNLLRGPSPANGIAPER